MLLRPIRIANHRVSYPLLVAIFDLYRDRQPLRAVRRLYLVAISPIPFGVLGVIKQDELVDETDQVKITFPGNIGRLNDGDPFTRSSDHFSDIIQGSVSRSHAKL